jgi:DNA polymerase theta
MHLVLQVIGMSATLPNLADLSGWLRASLFSTDFRPVPLTELLKIENTLLTKDMVPVGAVRPTVVIPNDTDHLAWLCLQTVLESHSVLLFCPAKAWVEKLAETLAKEFLALGRPDPADSDPVRMEVRRKLQSELSGERLEDVMVQLRNSPAGLDSTLARVLRVSAQSVEY